MRTAEAPAADTPAAEAPAETPVAGEGGGEAGSPAPIDPAELEPIIEIRELNDWYRAVVLEPLAITDPLALEAIGREICEGLTPCRAAMWFDAADTPTGFPVQEAQLRYSVFAFGRALSGDENILWNCDVYPEFEAERRCLPRPMN